MKRAGDLFDRILDPDNLRLAFVKASRGKRHREDQRRFAADSDAELRQLREGLADGTYPVGDYLRFRVYDPKEREICTAAFGERVLHHALMNVCEPVFDAKLAPTSFACRRSGGQTAALARAARLCQCNAWYMKCDIRKYFDSMPHAGMRGALGRQSRPARRELLERPAELPLREPQQERPRQPQQEQRLPPLGLPARKGKRLFRPGPFPGSRKGPKPKAPRGVGPRRRW